MDSRSPSKRFIDSFAEEMGRWFARVCSAGIVIGIGSIIPNLLR